MMMLLATGMSGPAIGITCAVIVVAVVGYWYLRRKKAAEPPKK